MNKWGCNCKKGCDIFHIKVIVVVKSKKLTWILEYWGEIA